MSDTEPRDGPQRGAWAIDGVTVPRSAAAVVRIQLLLAVDALSQSGMNSTLLTACPAPLEASMAAVVAGRAALGRFVASLVDAIVASLTTPEFNSLSDWLAYSYELRAWQALCTCLLACGA